MADDPTFEPGTAGQVARLVSAMRELRTEAAALGSSATLIASELAVMRAEVASPRGAQERSEAFLAAITAEQTRQAQQQAQIVDALGDLLDGTQAIYSLLTTAPPSPDHEGEPELPGAPGNGSHPADAPAEFGSS